ncbi:unnamed protein product [Nezara viridula]|uniref:Solute carrier family 46 member 3 n=1 Tax=Nezara viridula TaxID=85310 RepID=A0A9P0E5X5_NEZVI|nr:unnamed protein product [Nezara viridula]
MEKTSESENKQWREMRVKEKISYIVKNITVEPILTCYILPNIVASLATQNLNLEKACRVNLKSDNVTAEVCDMIKSRNVTKDIEQYEQEAQLLVVGMTYWQSVMRSTLPAIFILFLGSFSDRSGRRKPFMLLPIAGELLTSVGLILCTIYEDWPMEVAGFVEAIFPALTGGWTTMFMGVFSYMGDITSVDSRTLRLGIVNICVQLAAPLGMLSSGFLYQAIDFIGVFSIVTAMYVIGLIYGVIRIKEIRKPNKLKHNIIKELTNPMHIIETFRVSFKSREGNLRTRVILVMILSITIYGPINGELAVGYLFTRLQFHWDEVDFSIYSTYGIAVNLVGTTLGIGVFSHLMKMDDAMLGLIACSSKIIASIFYAFAKTSTQFYLASLIDMVGGTAVIAMRSIASKLVPSEELGKINSLFGVCEAVTPLIYQPLYSFVYQKTINTLPGAFFLVGSSLTLPTVLIFLYLYYLNKKQPLNGKILNKEDSHEIKTNEAFDMSEETLEAPANTKL